MSTADEYKNNLGYKTPEWWNQWHIEHDETHVLIDSMLGPINETEKSAQTMQPYQERVISEKYELDRRIKNLSAFIRTEEFRALGRAEMDRLSEQWRLMRDYSNILNERIIHF